MRHIIKGSQSLQLIQKAWWYYSEGFGFGKAQKMDDLFAFGANRLIKI
jgi:hypothetical protein